MDWGSLLTNWTIRLALSCYAATLAGELTLRAAPSWPRWGRWLWTLGCALFVVHVACAFHFYHGWSHADAAQHTAQRTQEMFGAPFGAGVYFSYGFLLLWLADVAWWWLAPEQYARRGWPAAAAIHAYLLFIAFNGAVVFEAGPTRWFGLAAIVVLAGLALWRWTASRSESAPAPCGSSSV